MSGSAAEPVGARLGPTGTAGPGPGGRNRATALVLIGWIVLLAAAAVAVVWLRH